MSLLRNQKGKFHNFLNMAAILREVLMASGDHLRVKDISFMEIFLWFILYSVCFYEYFLQYCCFHRRMAGLTLHDGSLVWQNSVISLLDLRTDRRLLRWCGHTMQRWPEAQSGQDGQWWRNLCITQFCYFYLRKSSKTVRKYTSVQVWILKFKLRLSTYVFITKLLTEGVCSNFIYI